MTDGGQNCAGKYPLAMRNSEYTTFPRAFIRTSTPLIPEVLLGCLLCERNDIFTVSNVFELELFQTKTSPDAVAVSAYRASTSH